MTINLSTEELTSLVEKHISNMGLHGKLNVTFNKKGNAVDTNVEILPVGTTETEAIATESFDSLIK